METQDLERRLRAMDFRAVRHDIDRWPELSGKMKAIGDLSDKASLGQFASLLGQMGSFPLYFALLEGQRPRNISDNVQASIIDYVGAYEKPLKTFQSDIKAVIGAYSSSFEHGFTRIVSQIIEISKKENLDDEKISLLLDEKREQLSAVSRAYNQFYNLSCEFDRKPKRHKHIASYNHFTESLGELDAQLSAMIDDYPQRDFSEDELGLFLKDVQKFKKRYSIKSRKSRKYAGISVLSRRKAIFGCRDRLYHVERFEESIRHHLSMFEEVAENKKKISDGASSMGQGIECLQRPCSDEAMAGIDYINELMHLEGTIVGLGTLDSCGTLYLENAINDYNSKNRRLAHMVSEKKAKIKDSLAGQLKTALAGPANGLPYEEKINLLNLSRRNAQEISQKAKLLSDGHLSRQCEETLRYVTGEISRIQSEDDRKNNVLRIGEMVIEDAKTFSLPKYLSSLECPDNYCCRGIHNTLLGQNGAKDWIDRVDRSAGILQELAPVQDKNILSYLQQLSSGVRAAMQHGYLATRIYGSMKRKNIVENFADSIDLYLQRCGERAAA